jgi:hypothetical protein
MATKAIDIFNKVRLRSKLLKLFIIDHQIDLPTIFL